MAPSTGQKNIYNQKLGYVVQIAPFKSKHFRKSAPNALQNAIAYRDAVLAGEIVPEKPGQKKAVIKAKSQKVAPTKKGTEKVQVKGKKGKFLVKKEQRAPRTPTPEELGFSWDNDARTIDLQIQVIEAEEAALAAKRKADHYTEELVKIRNRLADYERNRTAKVGEITFTKFKLLDTVCIVDGAYLSKATTLEEPRISVGLLRNMIEGMIHSHLESFIYVDTLPYEEGNRGAKEAWHNYIASKNGGGAYVIAHPMKESTVTCPKCSARFERYYQWAGDTVIAAEIVRWAVEKKVGRIILIAGDGDFNYPAQVARNFCKELVVMAFQDTASNKLQGIANRVIYLDEYKKILGEPPR